MMHNTPFDRSNSASSAKSDSTTHKAIEARSGTNILAEGLSPEQTTQLLNALIMRGKINAIGTPSREEMITPNKMQRDGLQALGGLLQGGEADRMMIELSIALVTSSDTSNGRCDVALTRMPMETNPLGLGEICVAQVYGASLAGQPMGEEVFESILCEVNAVEPVAEAPQTRLQRAVQASPSRTLEFAQDLSVEELSIRLSSLVRNNRVNAIISPNVGDSGMAAALNDTTLSEESVKAHVKRVELSVSSSKAGRFKITIVEYDEVPGLTGKLVAANLTADIDNSLTGVERLLPEQTEIVAERLSPSEAADALKVLWDDKKFDLLMMGSTSSGPGTKAMYPVGFKDESGRAMSAHEVLASCTSRLSKEHGNASLDVYLGKQQHARRNEQDSLVEGEGFLVILLAND